MSLFQSDLPLEQLKARWAPPPSRFIELQGTAEQEPFSRIILDALVGLAEPALRGRDAVGDFAKLHFAGRLARSARDADGLQSWITLRFKVPTN